MHLSAELTEKLSQQQHSFLHSFFLTAPDSFNGNLILKSYPKNHVLINADESCAHVYILLEGRLQAIEEHAPDTLYGFTELTGIDIIGDYELFTRVSTRVITLTAMVPCQFILIPSKAYLHWIRTDSNALFIRIQMILTQLTAQNRFERQNFLMDNKTRLLYFIYTQYHHRNIFEDVFKITLTRSEIAGKIGCSVRTINRMLNHLQKSGIISLCHGKIQISNRQYQMIRSYIRSYID